MELFSKLFPSLVILGFTPSWKERGLGVRTRVPWAPNQLLSETNMQHRAGASDPNPTSADEGLQDGLRSKAASPSSCWLTSKGQGITSQGTQQIPLGLPVKVSFANDDIWTAGTPGMHRGGHVTALVFLPQRHSLPWTMREGSKKPRLEGFLQYS